MAFYEPLIEKEVLPDWLTRGAIRFLNTRKIHSESSGGELKQKEKMHDFIESLKNSPIALSTADANEQHYEVPADFYKCVLGKRMKYSCGYWSSDVMNLDQSEDRMLQITCDRAQIANGQMILDLGCGWGSFSLYAAEKFPGSEITAVSNSESQKAYILDCARRKKLKNIRVITADMNDFHIDQQFDRVVSVEMFEHMRNYKELLKRISIWMKPEALLFVHIFVHKKFAYPFLDEGESDWMARNFFTDGIMPSEDLLEKFSDHLHIKQQWKVSGRHYQKTCNAWLENMDASRFELMPLFESVYGRESRKRFAGWRVFFMACAELFGHAKGDEWYVSHYLFERNR